MLSFRKYSELDESIKIEDRSNKIDCFVGGKLVFSATKSKVKQPSKHPLGVDHWLIYDYKKKKNLDLGELSRGKAVSTMKRLSKSLLT